MRRTTATTMRTVQLNTGVGVTNTFFIHNEPKRLGFVQDIHSANMRVSFDLPEEVVDHWTKCNQIYKQTGKKYARFFKRFTYRANYPVKIVTDDGEMVDAVLNHVYTMITVDANLNVTIAFDLNDVSTEPQPYKNREHHTWAYDLGCDTLRVPKSTMNMWFSRYLG